MTNNFDERIPRHGSHSYKWESAEEEDVLPMWVADMDFRTAPAVVEALQRRVAHGIFGYTRVPQTYYDAVVDWFEKRHHWPIKQDWILYTTGVVPALSAIMKALTTPGDRVVVQTPVYNCFFSSIRNNGCEMVANPLIYINETYRIDFADLEKSVADPKTKLLLLCNPHNPAGRVWTRQELTVTCTSPSKAFNLAGLQIANIFCADEVQRRQIDRAININEVCDVNPFGVEALIAAYKDGAEWLDELRHYLFVNYTYLKAYFNEYLSQLPVTKLEGTYLVWVDCRSLRSSSKEIEQLLIRKGKIWVNAGDVYGEAGEGFIRINIACPRQVLMEGLDRLRRALT